ncbi:MAG: DUF4350 domain-containing protein [Gammaproteobacteria bacterium]|nr:DUF4350 domain-containing protein [Gammaproteobacteria bacterium]
MRPVRAALIAVGVVAVAVSIGYFFYSNFEKVSEEINTGCQEEARNNPLLAAQRFFEANGLSVSSHEGLTELAPTTATMIIPSDRIEMGLKDAERYLQWVQNGGHLVVAAGHEIFFKAPRQDFLLDLAGIGLHKIEYHDDAESDTLEDDDSVTEKKISPNREYFVYVDWPGSPDYLTVHMNNFYRLKITQQKFPVLINLSDDAGSYFLRLRIGRGYLSVVYNSAFMENYEIGQYDHAAFLWRVATVDTPRPLWLVYRDQMPSLAAWLAHFAWTALVSVAVFLGLWLWYASRRFGPLLPSSTPTRRRLLEHVAATGRFLWQRGDGQLLYKGVYHVLVRTLEMRHPAWLSLSSADLKQRLADISRLPLAQVTQAMSYSHSKNEHEFAKSIQILEHIRKSL